jgi:hypothetical protein
MRFKIPPSPPQKKKSPLLHYFAVHLTVVVSTAGAIGTESFQKMQILEKFIFTGPVSG